MLEENHPALKLWSTKHRMREAVAHVMLVHRFFVDAAHCTVRPRGPQLNWVGSPTTARKVQHVPVENTEE